MWTKLKLISLQDALCQEYYNCDSAFRCYKSGWIADCCWPVEDDDICVYDTGCFPSSAMLSLGNGKTMVMSELEVGDRVQTGMNKYRLTLSKSNITSLK